MEGERYPLLKCYTEERIRQERFLLREEILWREFGTGLTASRGKRKKVLASADYQVRYRESAGNSRVLRILEKGTLLQSATLRGDYLEAERRVLEHTNTLEDAEKRMEEMLRKQFQEKARSLQSCSGEGKKPAGTHKSLDAMAAEHISAWADDLSEIIHRRLREEQLERVDRALARNPHVSDALDFLRRMQKKKNIRAFCQRCLQLSQSDFLSGKIRSLVPGGKISKGRMKQMKAEWSEELLDRLVKGLTPETMLEDLQQNRFYRAAMNEAARIWQYEYVIREHIGQVIPRHYRDLYPEARKMHRHFILHLGPTNSGKTHDAMESLRRCTGTGGEAVYLAPLRLLAYEQFDVLNKDGYPCTLITGEEEIQVPFSRIQSSTMEMASLSRHYDCAVLDECQMVSDLERGGAWTAAILGLCAEEIHLCAAPEAENILKKMVEGCGDELEVVRHERLTPLRVENQPFHFPEDVQQGDALVVFSRRDVYAVAAEIQRYFRNRIRHSVVYGALPHDVRHEEARRFAQGETQVVVATDAIGMGMNLPIRRIILMRIEKYDGVSTRPLLQSEIRQICGRAGRFGLYETGLVNAEAGKKYIRQCLEDPSEPLEKAVICFPPSLLDVETSLSDLLRRWIEMEPEEGWDKSREVHALSLAEELERRPIDKQLEYKLVSMAFDEKDLNLLELWRRFSGTERRGKRYDILQELPPAVTDPQAYQADDLGTLEACYRVCDLCFAYARGFLEGEERDYAMTLIMERKNNISQAIIAILARARLKGRTCRICRKPIPWSNPYSVCDACHQRSGMAEPYRRVGK